MENGFMPEARDGWMGGVNYGNYSQRPEVEATKNNV